MIFFKLKHKELGFRFDLFSIVIVIYVVDKCCAAYESDIENMPKKVLFVCFGNVCRSPIAEAVFTDEVKKAGERADWEIDSAAIDSRTVGRKPDSRAQLTMKAHNLSYSNKARQIETSDFKKFDYIFGMDEKNIADLQRLNPTDGTAKILLLGDFDPEGDRIINDPYFDRGSEGFKRCHQQAVRCCKGFLKQLKENKI